VNVWAAHWLCGHCPWLSALIVRLGVGVHGHMADSVGATNVIPEHLRRSGGLAAGRARPGGGEQAEGAGEVDGLGAVVRAELGV
jgi:hypothetical protein